MSTAKKKASHRPYIFGAVVWLCLTATLIFGYMRDGGTPRELALAIAAAFFVSLSLVGMAAKGLKAWAFGTAGGAVVGMFSALELFFGERFERAFFVSFSTLAFFTALGLILGALAEFIRFLHWIVHRAAEGEAGARRAVSSDLDDL